jgi:hypothetical protein
MPGPMTHKTEIDFKGRKLEIERGDICEYKGKRHRLHYIRLDKPQVLIQEISAKLRGLWAHRLPQKWVNISSIDNIVKIERD